MTKAFRTLMLVAATIAPVGVSAAAPCTSQTLCNYLGTTSLETLLIEILGFVVRIGAIFVILMLVYVGFLFVVARGDPPKLTTARNALMWTVVGALILLGAQAIAMGIQATVASLGG